MGEGTHQALQHRSVLPGIEAYSLLSDRTFPRHAHDQFGFGVIQSGAHRSWSGVGPVEAGPGDTITVNPGEMHDGSPIQGGVRRWRMIYADAGPMIRGLTDDVPDGTEFARPAIRDKPLADRVGFLFAALTAAVPDMLAVEQELMRTVAHLLVRHGSRPFPVRPPPLVARALQRLDDAPERPTTLAELAGLSGVSRFQLLRGFSRTVGVTPHAYLVQQRVRLARRLLLAGRRPAEAAIEAGFADQSHLTRAFRRQLGVTPARYVAAMA